MKTHKTAIVLILLVFSVCGYAQNTEITKVPTTPTAKDSIKFFGKIKSVKEMSYGAEEKFGEILKGGIYRTQTYKCDGKKNLIEYYDDEFVPTKIIIKYNDKGQKIEKRTYHDGQLDSTITWKYNDKGSLIEKDSYDANKVLFSKTKWKRNANDNVMEESKYDSLGNTISKEIMERDARGYCLGHTLYDNGTLKWKCTHKRDDKGNQIDKVRIAYNDFKMDTLWICKYKHDEFDNIIETDVYQGNQLVRKYFTKYNKDKVEIERKGFCYQYDDGDTYHGCTNVFRFYNSSGDPTLAYGYYFDSWVGDYLYWYSKYDKQGNIVENLEKHDYYYDDDYGVGKTPIMDGKYNEEKAKKLEQKIKSIKEFDNKTEYVYTYDKYGNWITKTTYEQGLNTMPICTGIVEREIEYYE
ncbi:MAG: hypothetical protein FWC39_06140 [Bacteroidetes bacterium]|nr:hypothetical protein [Bacteroidota bacterium]